jgi:hypothetical protein
LTIPRHWGRGWRILLSWGCRGWNLSPMPLVFVMLRDLQCLTSGWWVGDSNMYCIMAVILLVCDKELATFRQNWGIAYGQWTLPSGLRSPWFLAASDSWCLSTDIAWSYQFS